MSQQSFWEGGSKTLFFTGLFLGIASTLVVGMLFMLSSGASFGKALAGTGNTYVPPSGNLPQAPVAPVLPAPTGQLKPVDDKVDHIRGNKNAKVTLVEYSDFECPFCARHAPSINQALTEFPNDVRLVYRHYPLTQIHPNAQKAAEAVECAAKVGGEAKFWEMHDKLFEAQPTGLSIAVFKKLAGDIGLNQGNFDKCLDSGEMAGRVASDTASGNDAGVSGTPATFVNGILVEGAVPYTELQAAIQQVLAN